MGWALVLTFCGWALQWKVANIPPFLKFGLSPSRCHEELSRIPRGLKILDHVGVAMVVIAVVTMIEVDLNEIEGVSWGLGAPPSFSCSLCEGLEKFPATRIPQQLQLLNRWQH